MKTADEAPTDPSGRPDYRLSLALAVILMAAFFALTSPFGAITYLSFFARWSYWLLTMVENLVVLLLVVHFAQARLSRWQVVLVASLLATPLVFFTIVGIQMLLAYEVPPRDWGWMLTFIWPVCAAVTFVLGLLLPAQRAATPQAAESELLLRERLPLPLREAEILALAAQDHYVAVHTASEAPLVHMRFNDAMALMQGEGLQVHRSWWVAKSGVAQLRRRGKGAQLTLSSGIDVPVSKSGLRRLREAAWL